MFKPIEKTTAMYRSVVAELAKCTWPTWEELWESTVLVIVSSLLLSLFVFIVDLIAQNIVSYVT